MIDCPKCNGMKWGKGGVTKITFKKRRFWRKNKAQAAEAISKGGKSGLMAFIEKIGLRAKPETREFRHKSKRPTRGKLYRWKTVKKVDGVRLKVQCRGCGHIEDARVA